jgi:hypothetical protein
MYEFGKEANEDFVRRNLGPRGILDLESDCETETPDAVTARFKQAHGLFEERNPRGDVDELPQLTKQRESDEAAALAETRKQWQARLTWAGNKAQAVEDGIPPADRPNTEQSWADRRIADGYSVPSGGTRFERDVKRMKASIEFRMSEGADKAEAVSELRKITAAPYSQRVIDAAELAA